LAECSLLPAPGEPLLDQEIDLLLTRDRVALGYAATLPQSQSVPLPWQRTHVLLTPRRARPSLSLSPEARQILADDAVRGEARGAQEPFWYRYDGQTAVRGSQTGSVLCGTRCVNANRA